MNDGDARDSVKILLITCGTCLKCRDQVSVAGNRIHSSNLGGLGRVGGGGALCARVCNMSLLYLVWKGKKK